MEADPDETLGLLAEMTRATDAKLRGAAKSLAARLFIDLARERRVDRGGVGRITPQRYRPDGGDIDIDRSLDAIVSARAADRLVDTDELKVSGWAKSATAWCLVVDRSACGSSGGGARYRRLCRAVFLQ